ncbi:conjugal transfer protein TraN [Novosphingobium percolationis]|uniref:conjugal transfer protein TraN n=1 Tax=Novosphingobium percolationis TaxID=2871811 RepID=UPI001CD1A6D0|nr:conjugal transfer protein TraN [Novosphingobium percolationis]
MSTLRFRTALMLVVAAFPTIALSQTSQQAAREDGKAFGAGKAASAQAAATSTPDAARIPNYTANPAQAHWFSDPDAMARQAASDASSNAGYAAMRSSMDHRATFGRQDLDAVVARSKAVSSDPLQYTSGMSAGGTQGRCVPLPRASGAPARYIATCNTGYTADEVVRSCTVSLAASASAVPSYLYYCTDGEEDCTVFTAPLCRQSGSHAGRCLQGYTDQNGVEHCTEPGDPVYEFTCSAPIAGRTPVRVSSQNQITTSRDDSACASLASDTSCAQDAETCTDSSPETRLVNGVSVTAPCWAWSRSYTCAAYTAASDCTTLETTPGCLHVRDDCLTDQPCRTWEHVYDCPVPDTTQDPNQFICDGDVYCIDGSCQTIDRQPNTEFKDAVVALNAMDQARREFDPATLSLFKGERDTCASKVFGILNCCKGKGFPLIPGIQLLVMLGCSREEMLLHQRDVQGLCHYVGTYCSSSFLGVCLTKRKAYCCFESKLSRILQEQGRVQLNKPWGSPKKEQCDGFTVDEFAKLDLSKMDFSEVYAEFTSAARLPDELQAATEIQQKIEAYYAQTSH